MNLTTIRKGLWGLVALAAIGWLVLFLWDGGQDDDIEMSAGDAFKARFELTDHQGMVRTERDFAGRWMLVFFGYANCPDVCPTTLSEVAAVMDRLGDAAESVQPLFVSIDPERDTPMELAEYVPLFGVGIIGLTGTPEQISGTANSFHIFYERSGVPEAPEDYAMSHSSQLFLFGPDAGYVTSWQYGTPAEDILADLRRHIAK